MTPDQREAYRPTETNALLERLEAERDAALRECVDWARQAGEAKGRLEGSEMAGVVDGWRERALIAEVVVRDQAETIARLKSGLHDIREIALHGANGHIRAPIIETVDVALGKPARVLLDELGAG